MLVDSKRQLCLLALGAALGLGAVGARQPIAAAGPARNSAAAEFAKTSLWTSNPPPEVADSGDSSPAEVGVKFRSHVKGFITGIRFYKSEANTGTHVGTLWSQSGARLASATFTHETASGWQEVKFSRRIAIKPETTYVASYHTNSGHYSADALYFVAGRDNATLEALRSTAEAGNGVFASGAASSFPAPANHSINYWVDVTFEPARTPAGDTYLPWEGGSTYYKRWPNGPSPQGDPNYFPLAVWHQSTSTAEGYKALGINLFVALPPHESHSPSELADAGMGVFYLGVHKLMENREERQKLLAEWGPLAKAWGQIDEPDNAQELGEGKGVGPCVPPPEVIAVYQKYQQNDPTRPVYLGVGKAVDDFTQKHYHHPLRGSCNGQYEDYPAYLEGSDIVSYDSYPVNVFKPLWYVAKGMDELRDWAHYRKLIYETMETTALSATAGKPTPQQVKSEVWMTIIHGGMGLIYFCHIFTPKLDPAGLLHDPAMSHQVAAMDKRITSLAPVLNTPSVANGVRLSLSNEKTPVDVMLKRWSGSTYLFTVAARPNGATTATFNLRDCPAHATATVVDENREIPIVNGSFHDDFAGEYQVHIYRIGFSPVQ